MDQHTFVAGCLAYYAENYYEPGNPEDGEWHDCHYPVPERLGGTETIKLLVQHHAIQGVLQSDEYQYPCVWGWEDKYLPSDYLPLLHHWRDVASWMGGNKARMKLGTRVRITYTDGHTVIAYSIQQAVSITGVPHTTIKRRLELTASKTAIQTIPIQPRHNLAFEYAPDCNNRDERITSKPKQILIHYLDGTIVRANSIKHAVRITNINQSTIQHRLKRTVDDQLNPTTRRTHVSLRFEYIK